MQSLNIVTRTVTHYGQSLLTNCTDRCHGNGKTETVHGWNTWSQAKVRQIVWLLYSDGGRARRTLLVRESLRFHSQNAGGLAKCRWFWRSVILDSNSRQKLYLSMKLTNYNNDLFIVLQKWTNVMLFIFPLGWHNKSAIDEVENIWNGHILHNFDMKNILLAHLAMIFTVLSFLIMRMYEKDRSERLGWSGFRTALQLLHLEER